MSKRAPSPRDLVGRLRPTVAERPPFFEGLAIGAMIGAAIAGSTLWARLRESRRRREPDTGERRHSDPA
ncbi:MAG TPA: hypothetical protein VGJ17_07085 [Candidatus Limnocylindrales bacterium]|jgi:hypothetical protein